MIEVEQPLGHTDQIECTAISPDGRLIASGGNYLDKKICIWDAETGKLMAIVRPLTVGGQTMMSSSIVALTFSHSNKWLASVSSDHTVVFWDVTSARPAAGRTRTAGVHASSSRRRLGDFIHCALVTKS